MGRKWLFLVIASVLTMLLVFTLNLLWVGRSTTDSLLLGAIFALPVLAIGLRVKLPIRYSTWPFPRKTTLAIKIAVAFLLAVLIGAAIGYIIYSEGTAVGTTIGIGILCILTVCFVSYKRGYLKF